MVSKFGRAKRSLRDVDEVSRRQYEDKLKRRAEQLDARDEWLKPRTEPRKTAAEILRSFEEVGFQFGSQKKRRITVSPEEFTQRYGISRAEFDALGGP